MKLLDLIKDFPWNRSSNKDSTFPVLKKGNKNKYYLDILHKQLILAGGDAKKLSGDMISDYFGDDTYSEVIRFQQTHIGPDKQALDVDGIIGADSWWALFNFTGEDQKNNLSKVDSDIESSNRQKIINMARAQHSLGVVETPKGSNWGGQVSKYLKFCGLGPNPWCLAFVQWVTFEALKVSPWKSKTAHVATFWQICKGLGFAFNVKDYSPIPGDLFVIVHSDGTGHIGVITNVNSTSKASRLNVIEGNSGDRVALRERIVGANSHIGYINFYGDSKNRPNFSTSMSTSTSFEELNKTR